MGRASLLSEGLSWKLGEIELTQLICQYLFKFTFVVRSRTEQYDVSQKDSSFWSLSIESKHEYCNTLKRKGFFLLLTTKVILID